jgi:hypothetical protein
MRQDFACPEIKGGLSGRGDVPATDDLDDLIADQSVGDLEFAEGLADDAMVQDEAEQQVFGADVVVGELAGFSLGEDDHISGVLGEALERDSPSG